MRHDNSFRGVAIAMNWFCDIFGGVPVAVKMGDNMSNMSVALVIWWCCCRYRGVTIGYVADATTIYTFCNDSVVGIVINLKNICIGLMNTTSTTIVIGPLQ